MDTNSQHRHTKTVQERLEEYVNLPREQKIDALIIGAGWANHLTGCSDAYLRNTLGNDKIPVYGVAFKDKKNPKNTEAAILSITQVPGTQVIFRDYVGSRCFLRACQDVVEGELPQIKLKPIPLYNRRTINHACLAAIYLLNEKNKSYLKEERR